MSIQRYRHFLAVVDEAGFGRAAAKIGMKQPPLSQSVRRLERELGVALLERHPRGVILTNAGRAFLPEARAAVAATERATFLARAANTARGPVRIGVVSIAMWEVLPRLLQAAQEAMVPVHLEQSTTNDQLEALAEGSLDLGLVAPPFETPPRLRVTLLADEPIVLAAPATMVPKDGGAIPLSAVAARLIMFPRVNGPVLHDAILAMFRAGGFEPILVQESPQMLTTLALVAAGHGASLVPAALARRLVIKDVVFQSLGPTTKPPHWPVALAHMPLSAHSDAVKLLSRWRRKWPTASGASSIEPDTCGAEVNCSEEVARGLDCPEPSPAFPGRSIRAI